LWEAWNLHNLGWYLILVIGALTLFGGLISFKKLTLDSVLTLFAGFLYISLSWALMVKLRGRITAGFQADLGWVLPVVLIASIWINDTMAYITGSLFGRTPLSSISPNKTWEGTIGGVILSVMVVSYGGNGLFDLPLRPLIFISLIASVIGTLGDLLESKLKRMAGVKDSGQMMPGHGGFLDRFDSLLLATPYVWIFADLFL
jgi:phosphatidate cytidylyltransferase